MLQLFLYCLFTDIVVEINIFLFCSDMDCHIDDFIVVVAHTHVVENRLVIGRTADVLVVANTTT